MRASAPRITGKQDPDHFMRFCAERCVHTKGRWHRKPFVLEPWQAGITREALRTRRRRRVYRTVLIGVARKNGKSSLAAALGFYGASAEREHGPDVVMAAGSKEQAGIVFDQARAFADATPPIRAAFRPQRTIIEVPSTGGLIRRVSADGKLQHGLNPSIVVIDELWAFTTPHQAELYSAMVTSTGAREQPLTIIITTAG